MNPQPTKTLMTIDNIGYSEGLFTQLGNEILVWWPNFAVYDAATLERLDESQEFEEALRSDDPGCALLRYSIPPKVFAALVRFPQGTRAQILTLSQCGWMPTSSA